MNLTHLPLNKMAATVADNIFKCIFVNGKFYILIKISLNFVLKGPIDNNAALVQVMAWHQAITWTNADPAHWHIYAALLKFGNG